jgi:hypothetical protein
MIPAIEETAALAGKQIAEAVRAAKAMASLGDESRPTVAIYWSSLADAFEAGIAN